MIPFPKSNARKIALCLLLSSLLHLISSGQAHTHPKTIQEKYSYLEVNITPREGQFQLGLLNITTEMISSQDVDVLCTEAYERKGYMFYNDSIQNLNKDASTLLKKQRKTNRELILEALVQLRDSGLIKTTEYERLLDQVYLRQNGANGENPNGPVRYNVLRFQSNPLTTMKFTVTNTGNQTISYSPTADIIYNGVILTSYSLQELIGLSREREMASFILHGLYAEQEYSIPPGVTFSFLMAFPPIDTAQPSFDLYLQGNKQTFHIQTEQLRKDEKVPYYPMEIQLVDKANFDIKPNMVYLISTTRGVKSRVEKGAFLVHQKEVDQSMEILTICFHDQRVYWGRFSFYPNTFLDKRSPSELKVKVAEL